MSSGAECARCFGSGFEPLYRCPLSILRGASELAPFWSALRALENHGALPQAGGWSDQPASFVEAHDLVVPFLAELRTPPKVVEVKHHGG